MRDFAKEIKEKHPNITLLESVKKGNEKIKVRCELDDYEWETRAYDLLKGYGCHRCSGNERYTTETFKKKMEEKNIPFILKSEYKNSHTKIVVECKECGEITEKRAYTLLQNRGCKRCKYKNINTKSKSDYRKEFDSIYNGEFILLEDYKGSQDDIEVFHSVCKKTFKRKASVLVTKKSLCPHCQYNKSIGEMIVKDYLERKGIDFEEQKIFKDFYIKKRAGRPKFDFYLPEFNACIEYDGIQHFEPVEKFGGKEEFVLTKERDSRKDEYCKENGIRLLRIPYFEKDIKEMLEKFLSR